MMICQSHEQQSQKLDKLLEACTSNTTTIRMLLWLVSGACGVLMLIASVYIPMMYQSSRRVDAQITSAIAGTSANRRDNLRQDEVLHDHESRLRTGGL